LPFLRFLGCRRKKAIPWSNFSQTQLWLPPDRVKWDGVTKALDLEPVIHLKAMGIDFLRKLMLSWFTPEGLLAIREPFRVKLGTSPGAILDRHCGGGWMISGLDSIPMSFLGERKGS
jgi:hypothetical protein